MGDNFSNPNISQNKRRTTVPYGRQSIDEKDVAAVCSVLRSDWLTQGPRVGEFEELLADYCGVKYAVVVSNGTAALHIACLAVGLRKGDVLWTSPNTFVASTNCALYCGAQPDFVDIDPHIYNIDVKALESKLAEAEKNGSLPKVVLAVHFAGQSCDMEYIYSLSQRYNFSIIEDACHALGSTYKNKKVGSCVFSDVTVLSFHPVKHLTTGEGGAVLTNSHELYEKLMLLRNHGINRNPEKFTNKQLAYTDTPLPNSQTEAQNPGTPNPWYYEQIDLGFNYRITDIQCALGISQMDRLEYFKDRRHSIVQKYNNAFKDNRYLTIPFESSDNNSSFHLYVLLFDFDNIGLPRSEVMNRLRENGVGSQVHYIPVYKHPYYKKFGYSDNNYPNTEMYYKKALSIPLFPAMQDEDVENVIGAVLKVINEKD